MLPALIALFRRQVPVAATLREPLQLAKSRLVIEFRGLLPH